MKINRNFGKGALSSFITFTTLSLIVMWLVIHNNVKALFVPAIIIFLSCMYFTIWETIAIILEKRLENRAEKDNGKQNS